MGKKNPRKTTSGSSEFTHRNGQDAISSQGFTFPFMFEAERLEVNSYLNRTLQMVMNGKSSLCEQRFCPMEKSVWGAGEWKAFLMKTQKNPSELGGEAPGGRRRKNPY